MAKPSATTARPGSAERGEARPSWIERFRRWSRRDEAEAAPPVGRVWPLWACWVISPLILFHIVAVLACEVAGQVQYSPLEFNFGLVFWPYVVLIDQDHAHSYFAPEPDPSVPVVTARLHFAEGQPDRKVRIPDPTTRPRIRYVRQIALAWHLSHELSGTGLQQQPHWAASYARNLCRLNPGCTQVDLAIRLHRLPDLNAVVSAATRGETPDIDDESLYGSKIPDFAVPIGEFPCDRP